MRVRTRPWPGAREGQRLVTSAPGRLTCSCSRGRAGQRPSANGPACRPGSVLRPCGRRGDHPSTTAVADGLQRSTRALGRAALGRALSDLAPGGVCRATPVARRAGGLLLHRFTLTSCGLATPGGGLFSVALSRGSPRVGVTHHPALRSPDLPRRPRISPWSTRSPGRPVRPDRIGPAAGVAHGVPRLGTGEPSASGPARLRRAG